MNHAVEWHDAFLDTRERKVLTEQEHGVPGLKGFGYHNAAHALSPLQPHYHKDCFELTFLARGNVRFSIGGENFDLSGGDLLLTMPNEVHDTGMVPMSLHQMFWLQLVDGDPDHLLYLQPEAASYLLDKLRHMPRRVIRMKGQGIDTMLLTIFRDLSGGTEAGRWKGAQLLGYLLFDILDNASNPEQAVTEDIERVTAYILAHLDRELTMEELAKISLLSVSRFKQKFKDQTGTSPRSFINYHKIEAAKTLLQKGCSVSDTAYRLGFSSSNYFCEVFRRYTSFAPTVYLRQQSAAIDRSMPTTERPDSL